MLSKLKYYYNRLMFILFEDLINEEVSSWRHDYRNDLYNYYLGDKNESN